MRIRTRRAAPSRRQRRRGFLTFELTLTLPILLLVLMAVIEFSLLLFARGQLVDACRMAARTASRPEAQAHDVERAIQQVLDPRLQTGLMVSSELGERTGDTVQVTLEVPMRQAAPDLLWPIGFGLQGRTLIAETRMLKE